MTIRTVRDMENVVLAQSWVCIVFTRSQCPACSEALPRVRRMLKRFTDIVGCSFNIDDDPSAAGRYLIFDTPAVLFYYNGKPVVRQIGAVSVPELYKAVLKIHQLNDLA